MTQDDAVTTLEKLLALTREEEIDCDAFQAHLAAWLEGNVDKSVRALLEHHQLVCPECAEERALLARALGLDGC